MLVRRFNELAAANNVPAQMIGIGGQFQPYFTDSDVKDYRTAASSDQKSYAIFAKSIFDSGLLVHQSYLFHHGVSDAHGKDEYDEIIRAFEKGLHDVARGTP
jgi:glutamate-1-semialdehyde aminotransferase